MANTFDNGLYIDGQYFDVPLLSCKRKANFLWKYADRTEDGVHEGEKLGTYFNYTLSIGRIVNKNVYNALYDKLVSNDEYHTVQMPSADGQMFTFEAYFDSISDEIVRSIDGVNTFKGLTVEFIARRRAL